MELTNRDFISLTSFQKDELEWLLDLALAMKAKKDTKQYLSGRTIGLLFAVPSTRTRISFQVGARQLGAHAEYFNYHDLQLANHESMIDTASVMGRYLDALIARIYDMDSYGQGRDTLMTLAEHCEAPVINALDDKDHPCQVMADILTIREKFGKHYKRKKIVFTWGYASRLKSPGVPHSMLTAASLLGMTVTFAHPRGYELDSHYLKLAEKACIDSKANIEFSSNLNEAVKNADVIYVKSWKSLAMPREEDIQLRNEIRPDWCVSPKHFQDANAGAYFMNCMPLIRGEQAMTEVVDSKQSIIYDQAENRLHVQKAIMAALLA